MINVADRIELHSFQNDLLNDPFTKLYKDNTLKKYLKDMEKNLLKASNL